MINRQIEEQQGNLVALIRENALYPGESDERAFFEHLWQVLVEEAPERAVGSGPDGLRYGFMAGYQAGVLAFIAQGYA